MKTTPAQTILWFAMVITNLEYLLTCVYAGSQEWLIPGGQSACVLFLVIQPFIYTVLYLLYILQN